MVDLINLFPEIKEKHFFQDPITKEYWFHATGVCKALGFANVGRTIGNYCDDDEIYQEIHDGKSTWFISESGCYGLAFQSKKEGAKKFKRWLKHEVLPKLRKEGGYINPEATPEQLEGLQNQIKELQAKYEIAVEDCHQMAFESFAHICYDCFGMSIQEYDSLYQKGYGFKHKKFPAISYEKLLSKIHKYFNRLVLMENKPDFRTPAKQAEIIAKWNEKRPGKPKNAREIKVTSLFQQKHDFLAFVKFLIKIEEDKLIKEGLINWTKTVNLS